MISGHASGDAVIAVVSTMTVLAVVLVTLRLYARFWVSKNAGWDDTFIVISVLFSIATMITMIVQVDKGLGRHVSTIGKHEAMLNLRAFWASIVVYNVALTCTKLSILFQYLRLFPMKPFRIATWTMIGIVIAYFIWRFFSQIFACVPIAAYWDHSIKPKHCIDRVATSFTSTTLNMVTDLIIAGLPLPMLSKLALPTRQRHALVAVFALGGFVCIVSILRLPYLYVSIHTDDVSYHNPMAAILSNVECNVGILCSCVPTLRCLFPKMFKNASQYMTSSQSSTGFHTKGKSYTYGSDSFSTHKGPIITHATGPAAPHPAKTSPRKSKSNFRAIGKRDLALLDEAEGIDQFELESRLNSGANGDTILVRTDIDQRSIGTDRANDEESLRGLVGAKRRSLSQI